MPRLPVTIFFILILFPLSFDVGSVFMTGTRLLLVVLFIPMCFQLITGQLGRILPTDILIFLFAIWNILTLFLNSPDQAISFGGSVALETFGSYMVGRTYVRTAEDFARMCLALFWTIVITLPFAVYESQTGVAPIPTLLEKLPFFYSVGDFYNEAAGIRWGLERTQVVFTHPIHYGLYCSTAFALAFVGFRGFITNTSRFFFAGAAATGVFFSLSSGAILPMVLQIGLILWAWIMHSSPLKWRIFGFLVALSYIVVDMLSNRNPITVFLVYATFSEWNAYWRILIFEFGMQNVWNNPFFGLGMNTWLRPSWMVSGSMDNYWLLIAYRYGIPGFILLAAGWVIAFIRIALRPFDGGDPVWQLRRAYTITLTSLILTLATVDVWATAEAYVFLMLGSGVWLISAQSSSVNTSDAALVDLEQSSVGRFTRFPPTA